MRTRYRKMGWLCAALAAVLCLALALPQKNSLARIFIDNDKESTLTVDRENLDKAGWADLGEVQVDVYLYKIAEIDQYGEYTFVSGFGDLAGQIPEGVIDIEELNKTVFQASATGWETTAHWVAGLLGLPVFSSTKDYDKTEDSPEAGGEDQASDGQKFVVPSDEDLKKLPCYCETISAGSASHVVDQGLYLVWAKPFVTKQYLYTFLPYLVSVPDNAYGRADDPNASSDDWNYDVVVDLKPERQERYLDLEIDKTLLNYQAASGQAAFVFEIKAEKEVTENGATTTKVVYDDVVGLEFAENGQKSVRVRNIPACSKVTITEIRTGTAYELVSKKITPTDGVILDTTETADGIIINSLSGNGDWVSTQGEGDNELVAVISFTNDYSEEDGPKTDSIINRFTRIDGKWTGAQITTNQGGGSSQ